MTQQFALCINNEGYEASLEVGKMYRIIDKSGEDYAFGDSRFHRVELPDVVGEMLASTQQV